MTEKEHGQNVRLAAQTLRLAVAAARDAGLTVSFGDEFHDYVNGDGDNDVPKRAFNIWKDF